MKFVILRHETDDPHYDLMFETGRELSTWRMPESDMDLFLGGESVTVNKIHDHDKRYLGYEGPVSGGRGAVKRFDAGDFSSENFSDEGGEALMLGKKISGTLSLKKEGNDKYSLRYDKFIFGDDNLKNIC